ncbi:hypothetical protein ABZ845_06895 [Streptomyces sp. NPDC047022]|uniref:hypothetical protein n=1 Tax=Streptomyces sp. NPDC047022 TaxID=3155737 RepID=UPI0033CD09A7
MSKTPRVIGVLSEPAEPSWWKQHRHVALLIAGLFVGYQLSGPASDAHEAPQPKPSHSAPSTPGAESDKPIHTSDRSAKD